MPSMSEEARSETAGKQETPAADSMDSDFGSSLDSEIGYASETASSASDLSYSSSLTEECSLEEREKKRVRGNEKDSKVGNTSAVGVEENDTTRQSGIETLSVTTIVKSTKVLSQDAASGEDLDLLDSWRTLGDSVITDQLSQEASETDERDLDDGEERPKETQFDTAQSSREKDSGDMQHSTALATMSSAASLSESPKEIPDQNSRQKKCDHKNFHDSDNNTENSSRLGYTEECYPECHFQGSDGSQPGSFINFTRQNDAATSNSASRSIETSFVTGSNKKVLISEDKMREIQRQLFGSQLSDNCGSQPERSSVVDDRRNCNEERSIVQTEGLKMEEEEEDYVAASAIRSDIYEAFQAVLTAFPGEDRRWLVIQFKWAWMDTWMKGFYRSVLSVTPRLNTAERAEAIIQKIRLRQTYEDSVLKRIAEFDETPRRHMVLGILEVKDDIAVLYDGFYSVQALIGQELASFFGANGCSIGTKIHVFGSERVIGNPVDILELRGPLLRLFGNSVRVADSSTSLGAKRSVSFRVRLVDILPSGGVVSAVIVRIRRVLEKKFRVQLGGYRNDVDDYEEEIKKISALIEKSTKSGPSEYSMEDLRITPFVKLRVADSSGEALMVWWQPQEIQEGETFKFIYLRAVPGREWYLMADRRSYAEKVS